MSQAILVLLILGLVAADELNCPAAVRATKENIHYTASMNMDCPAATAHAEATLVSYHYRVACRDTFGLSYVPDSVSDVKVVDCFEAPAPGWPSGTVVKV